MNSTEPTVSKGISYRTKKVLVVTGAIVAALLLAFMVFAILVTPLRQPYRDALAQYNNVIHAGALLGAAGSSLNASGATDEQFNKNIDTARNFVNSLKTENQALGKEAVLTTGEGKVLYDAYNAKLQAFITYNTNVLAAMQKVRPVLVLCSQSMTNVSEDAKAAAAVRTCSDKLNALGGIPDADYTQLVVSFQTEYAKLATILEQLATTDPADTAVVQDLTQQRTDTLTAINTASTTFSENVQSTRKTILTTDTQQKLEDYLKSHSSVVGV